MLETKMKELSLLKYLEKHNVNTATAFAAKTPDTQPAH
jgi:hypothetical protein